MLEDAIERKRTSARIVAAFSESDDQNYKDKIERQYEQNSNEVLILELLSNYKNNVIVDYSAS